MVLALANEPSPRLLKHVVRCYLRLSDNPRYVSVKLFFFVIYTVYFYIYCIHLLKA